MTLEGCKWIYIYSVFNRPEQIRPWNVTNHKKKKKKSRYPSLPIWPAGFPSHVHWGESDQVILRIWKQSHTGMLVLMEKIHFPWLRWTSFDAVHNCLLCFWMSWPLPVARTTPGWSPGQKNLNFPAHTCITSRGIQTGPGWPCVCLAGWKVFTIMAWLQPSC